VDRTQLFDLKADSDEVKDLAGDPRHAGKVKELMTALAQQQQVFGDNQPLTVEKPQAAEIDPAVFQPKK
jgi:hypothetical protein